MIKVKDHYFISELGKRTNNEDKYGLIEGLIYVVCDGVGGAGSRNQ
jgi:serine/threonine protein phosphatase PrpC